MTQLRDGMATVNEVAELFDISLPAISRHLKVLERANLIVRTRDAQFRRCVLTPEGIDAAANWIEEHRQFWTEQLDARAHFLAAPNEPSEKDDDK